jgi:hypothetical protein
MQSNKTSSGENPLTCMPMDIELLEIKYAIFANVHNHHYMLASSRKKDKKLVKKERKPKNMLTFVKFLVRGVLPV